MHIISCTHNGVLSIRQRQFSNMMVIIMITLRKSHDYISGKKHSTDVAAFEPSPPPTHMLAKLFNALGIPFVFLGE